MDKDAETINGTIISYTERWKRFAQNLCFKIFQRFMSYYKAVPLLQQFNEKLAALHIHKSFDVGRYKNGWSSFWDKAAAISSLGPPFSVAVYHRPRIKQFGFVLFESPKVQQSELWTWINSESTSILLISMGSVVTLTEHQMHRIYTQLLEHSKNNNYRVLWALRQNIDSNRTNDALETDYFKISRWIPQHEVLQHENVKLFFSHAGSGGSIEGLYSKKLMILYPFAGDQNMNAQRLFALECGLIVNDRDNLSDLTQHIDTLLLNTTTSAYYQSKLDYAHAVISQNGGISEAVDFVEYAANYGVKHLLCAYGTSYDCTRNVIPWYQQCALDIYLVGLLMAFLFIVILRKCCDCFIGFAQGMKQNKTKRD